MILVNEFYKKKLIKIDVLDVVLDFFVLFEDNIWFFIFGVLNKIGIFIYILIFKWRWGYDIFVGKIMLIIIYGKI